VEGCERERWRKIEAEIVPPPGELKEDFKRELEQAVENQSKSLLKKKKKKGIDL